MICKFISGGDDIKELYYGIILILTSFIGGSMIIDLPQKFRNIFKTVYGRFFVFFLLNQVYHRNNPTITLYEIIFEAIIAVIILQTIQYVLYYLYT